MKPLPILILSAALLGVCAPRAEAQPATARKHFERAQKDFDSGRYKEAVEGYKAAYAAAPEKHALLYNIGLAYHRAGLVPEALASYERYLELDPNGPAADEVREYVAQFRALLNKEPAPPDPQEQPAPTVPVPPTVTSEPEPVEADAHPAPKPPKPEVPMTRTEKKGWIVGSGGVVLLASGIAVGMWASSTEQEVEDIYNGGRAFPDGKHLKGRVLDVSSIGLSVLGTAAMLGGAFYVWRGRSEERDASLSLVPFGAADQAYGLGAVGRF